MKNKPFKVCSILCLKTFILCIWMCTLGLFAFNGSAQGIDDVNISLNVKDATVKYLLHTIEQKTPFTFAYQESLVSGISKKVSIKANEQSVASVLNYISGITNLSFKQVNVNTIAINLIADNRSLFNPGPKSMAQTQIKGKVSDGIGQPLPGANVVEKGTSNGTQTDFDGNFSINVNDENAVLVISYLGFLTREIPLNGQTNITVSLQEDAAGLDEVVVIGFGTIKKANLTGSVDQLDVDGLGIRPNSSVIASLQGTLPGLVVQNNNGDPRQNAEINVRGFNSINGGSPLVLIDGIAGNINLLNPNDIESVTVLKDAGSAAIYGARAAFGVILVTTKKGKEGKVQINYSNTLAVTSTAARTDYISDPVLYGRTIDAAQGGFNGTTLTGYTSEEDWRRLQEVASGRVLPYRELQANGTFKFYDDTDWHEYLFKKSVISKIHNISISGGSEKLKAYLSGRVFNTGTVQRLRDEEVNRYNLKANLSLKLNDWLEISSDTQYNSGNQIEYGGRDRGWGLNWTYANNYLHAFHPTEIDGIPYDNRGQSTHASIIAGQSFEDYDYKQLVNMLSAKITPFNNLSINIDYSKRFTNENFKRRLNPFQYLIGPNTVLRTTGLNRLTEEDTESIYNVLNVYSTVEASISEKHNFKLLVGYNQEDFDEEAVTAEQGELFDPNFSNLNLGTELLQIDGSTSRWAVQGVFGRFNYDFDKKYLLEINARYDGSSRFPEESRFGFFPSASAGWHVSREGFWKPLENAISNFKIRGSFGELGNQNVGLYTFSQLLAIGRTNWLTKDAPLNFAGAPSPLPSVVTWERTLTTNLGLDLSFFNNKLSATLDVFQKQVKDMYLPGEPLPSVFGAAEPRENNADLEVKGFELSVGYNDSFIVGESPLNLRVTASLTNSTGRITKYSNPNGILSSFYVGQRLGDIWGYRVDGQFQSDQEAAAYQDQFENPSVNLGQVYNFAQNVTQNSDWQGLRAGDLKYLDVDGDGEISRAENTLQDPGDLQVIGNGMPRFPFGFTIGADWKGIDLFIQGAGVGSQDWYPRGRLYWGTYERPYVAFIRKDLVAQAWSPENPNGKFPQINRGYTALSSNRQLSAINDHFLTNLGYLRIKNLTLGYTLPVNITQKVGIDRFRLFLSGENIFTFSFGGLTRYIDPEQAGSGISLSNPNGAFPNTSRDRNAVEDYPLGKTISLGLDITL